MKARTETTPLSIETVSKRMLAPDEEWQQRRDAMRDLKGMVGSQENKYSPLNSSDVTADSLLVLASPFSHTIKDLRSAVVKEACDSFATIVESLGGSKCRLLLRDVFPTLMTARGTSNKVNTNAVHACIQRIVQSSNGKYVMEPILETLASSKNREVRESCIQYIGLAFSHWSKSSLEPFQMPLQKSILKSLRDASQQSREVARQCYWKYVAMWPEDEKIDNNLTPGVKKHLKRTASDNSIRSETESAKRRRLATITNSQRTNRSAAKSLGFEQDEKPYNRPTRVRVDESSQRPHTTVGSSRTQKPTSMMSPGMKSSYKGPLRVLVKPPIGAHQSVSKPSAPVKPVPTSKPVTRPRPMTSNASKPTVTSQKAAVPSKSTISSKPTAPSSSQAKKTKVSYMKLEEKYIKARKVLEETKAEVKVLRMQLEQERMQKEEWRSAQCLDQSPCTSHPISNDVEDKQSTAERSEVDAASSLTEQWAKELKELPESATEPASNDAEERVRVAQDAAMDVDMEGKEEQHSPMEEPAEEEVIPTAEPEVEPAHEVSLEDAKDECEKEHDELSEQADSNFTDIKEGDADHSVVETKGK